MKIRSTIACVLLCASQLTGCASTNIPAYQDIDETTSTPKDEQELWTQAKDLEQRFIAYDILYSDPAALAYLQSIVDEMVAGIDNLPAPGPKVYLVNTTNRNAYALPHGALYFNIGLVASLENEAEFATIAGHEVSHYLHRHAFRQSRLVANKEKQAMFGNLLATIIGAAIAGEAGANAMSTISQNMANAWQLAAVSGYSQDLEWEADKEGLFLMINAGYDGRSAPKIFERLKSRATNEGESYYSTHPNMEARQSHYQEIVANYDFDKTTHGRTASRFLENLEPLTLDVIGLLIKEGDADSANDLLNSFLERDPSNGDALFLKAELMRHSGVDPDQQIVLYKAAVTSPNPNVHAWKELGMAYRISGDMQQASHFLSRYLQLVPEAVEAPLFRKYINQGNTGDTE